MFKKENVQSVQTVTKLHLDINIIIAETGKSYYFVTYTVKMYYVRIKPNAILKMYITFKKKKKKLMFP